MNLIDSLREWLFNPPLWSLGIALVASVGVLGYGLLRGVRTFVRGGAILLAVAALWVGISVLFQSDREIVTRHAHGLVDAYRTGDFATLQRMLDRDTTLLREIRGGEEIASLARVQWELLDHGRIAIIGTEVSDNPLGLLVDLNIFSEQRKGPVPSIRTEWRLDYRKIDDAWTLVGIDALPTERIDPSRIRDQVRRGR